MEEEFRPGKDCFGLDDSQVRLYTATARHTVLVMAALAICAITAAAMRHRTPGQPPLPVRPDQSPPADPGMIPLTAPETACSPPPSPCPPRPVMPRTGRHGTAATKPAPAGTTTAHDSPARSPWSANEWRLPY